MFSRRRQSPDVPRGDVLLTVDTYAEAQSVINRLAHAGHAVATMSIIGRELVTVERITGRLTYARVALRGALNGAWFGLFVGLMLTVVSTPETAIVLPAVVAIGAGGGMLLSLITYSFRRKSHDYASVQQVLASRYDVVVPVGTVENVRAILDKAPRDDS